MRKELELDQIRSNLIRQEETIIFSIIERAQFMINEAIYDQKLLKIPDHQCSFLDYLLTKTEQVHATVRRYQSPDEVPFTQNLPHPIIKDSDYDWPIVKNKINYNDKIFKIYTRDIIPVICKPGDDGHYGSSAVNDVAVLQALSKRIHYGKYVAESKYIEEQKAFDQLIKEKKHALILEKITNQEVEEKLLERVFIKASTYGQDPKCEKREYKIKPEVIREIYKKWIIPLTKDVEIDYLIHRKSKTKQHLNLLS